jgi:quercetin dioxygenase-like cupin family protein
LAAAYDGFADGHHPRHGLLGQDRSGNDITISTTQGGSTLDIDGRGLGRLHQGQAADCSRWHRRGAVRATNVGMRMIEGQKACEPLQLHKHRYDHTLLVFKGRLRVKWQFDKEGKPNAGVWPADGASAGPGATVLIKAGVEHEIIPETDDWGFVCIFSHRDFDGVVVESYGACLGNPAAYN